MVNEIKNPRGYQAAITASKNQLIVLDFYADWCGPCKAIAPRLPELGVPVYKVNVDLQEKLAEEYDIRAMPTFKLIKDGVVKKTITGADFTKLAAAVKRFQ